MTLSTEQLQARVAAYREYGTIEKAALAMGVSKSAFGESIQKAEQLARQGLLGTSPVMPGFRISKVSNTPNGDYIQQKPDHGDTYKPIDSLALKGRTSWAEVLPDGQRIVTREVLMERADSKAQQEALRVIIDELKQDLPRLAPRAGPIRTFVNLLNQYTVTDSHFGMLAHAEETGADYDLKEAEQVTLDWFAASIAQSPDAHTAILAQLGDLMHHDALESVTPAHKHVLDADSRLHKVIRVVIRTIRRVIDMLLDKHQHVHVVMASGNHDPASSVWLREMLAVLYEDEPRITVDTSPKLYYAFMWGKTLLAYHHGHKRNINNVDATIVGMFKELYGQSNYAYCHIGHFHSDEGKKSGLMYIERHETLAAPDAYAAGGGYLSGRSAKRITYHKEFGEVGRDTLRPEMVVGAYSLPVAANDNAQVERKAA